MNAAEKKRILRDTRGQSLVEFALILPMFLVVMLMITEFGRAIYQFNVLSQATREAVRAAVVAGSGNAVSTGQARIADFLGRANMSGVSYNVEVLNNYGGVNGVNVVRATADKPFTWAWAGSSMPVNAGAGAATAAKGAKSSWTLHGESIMKAEF